MLDRVKADLRFAGTLAKGAHMMLVTLRDGARVSAARLVEETAGRDPDRTALLFEDRRYSWREFDEAANRVANAFRARGAEKGDVVALLMDNRPEYLITMIGLNKLGVVTSLVNTHVSGDPLVHALRICHPRFVLVGDEHLESVREIEAQLPEAVKGQVLVWREKPETPIPAWAEAFDPLFEKASRANPGTTNEQTVDDAMLYMYTSGTTGLPKAAKIKNQRFLRAAMSFGRHLAELRPDDVTYLALPLYHATGAVASFGSVVATGSAIALRRKFSATQFWDDCVKYGVTGFNYIGEVCRYLLHTKTHPLERKHKVRFMMGAGLRPDVWTPFQQRFGVPRVIEFYAATEGNVAIVNLDGTPGMLGRLMPGQVVVKIDPDTEDFVRDARGLLVKALPGEAGILVGRINTLNRFDGYLDSKKTDEKILRNAFGDGGDYFNTGDLVNLHPRGYVSFADRLGDTFRWKGENVSTGEMSIVLNRCPGVLESNVYGVEVPGAEGRAGMAAVSVGPEFDIQAFAKHCLDSLPRYSLPYFVRLQPQMELTGSFKYVKTHLKRDGFDPSKVNEPLYFLDVVAKEYVPVTPELYERIARGEVAV